MSYEQSCGVKVRDWGEGRKLRGVAGHRPARERTRETRARRLRRMWGDKRAMERVFRGIARSPEFQRELVNTTTGEVFGSPGAQAVWWDRMAARMGRCGQRVHVSRCECGYADSFTGYQECGVKLCAFAAKARSEAHHRRILQAVKAMVSPRLVTLTVKHVRADGLASATEKLMGGFGRLRARVAWKRLVRGGIWSLETPWNEEHGWHPHLHMIVDGDYLPQGKLSELWLEATGDSSIVDVRAVDAKAVSEVAKYVAKPATFLYEHERQDDGSYEVVREGGRRVARPIERQMALVREFMEATKGMRTMGAFGSMHGRLAEFEEQAAAEAEPKTCEACGAVERFELVVMTYEEAEALYEGQAELEVRVRGPPQNRAS